MSGKHLTRRQRRAGGNEQFASPDDIPMVKPDYGSKPDAKTLFEVAEERREELLHKADERQASLPTPQGNPGEQGGPGEEALLETLTYTITLSIIHFTFDILVQHQYAQEIDWWGTLDKLKLISPMIIVMVSIMHAAPMMRFPFLRQLVFLAGAVGSGCYGLWLGNMEPYLAVNKKFPPVAVMCIWTVLEMRLAFNAVFLAFVVAYAWWNKFLPY